jgi:mono/diheme cytochrome c family protein
LKKELVKDWHWAKGAYFSQDRSKETQGAIYSLLLQHCLICHGVSGVYRQQKDGKNPIGQAALEGKRDKAPSRRSVSTKFRAGTDTQ